MKGLKTDQIHNLTCVLYIISIRILCVGGFKRKKHILKAINEFMDEITRNAATPAKHYLFNVRESTKLDEERAENFHSVVALLLFVSRRCRLDIQTAVAFLTTRVSEPTLDDWNKLKRVSPHSWNRLYCLRKSQTSMTCLKQQSFSEFIGW